MECVDSDGSYQCVCARGFTEVVGICICHHVLKSGNPETEVLTIREWPVLLSHFYVFQMSNGPPGFFLIVAHPFVAVA